MKKKQTTAKREVIDERELKKEFGKILSIRYQGDKCEKTKQRIEL